MWNLCFGLLAILIVVGNLVTIWIFLKQRLRKRAHFLLISLAFADLLVGLLSVPLYIAISANPGEVMLVTLALRYGDPFTGIASIFTLAAISLERMYAIAWPFRHRTLTFRVYIFAIAIPWIVAVIFTSIVLLLNLSIITQENFFYPLILFQSTPLLAMCIAYCVIWRKQTVMKGNRNHVVREIGLAKTLLIITAASLFTWLPFQISNLLANRVVLGSFPQIIITAHVIKFLQFSNSLVNVIIYPFRISEFKNSLLQMFRCCVSPRERRNEVVAMHQGRLGQPHHFQELNIRNH